MRILLDTHCWLWMTMAPERFSTNVLRQIENPDTERYLSAASAWEIAIKCALGKLRLPDSPRDYLASHLQDTQTTPLAITVDHASHVADLPPLHGDPFDRLLIAQARLERLPILTSDPWFKKYDVDVIEA